MICPSITTDSQRGYKLLHLSAWGKNKPVPKESKPYDLFFNYMLWFPDTPKPDMHLNELSFIGHQEKKTEFRPICCSLFGGPGGVFLPLITGVFVVFKDLVMVDIEFRYTNDSVNIPPTCRRLHRCKRGDGLHTMYFDINGPGGEFIETVDFAILRGLKVCTTISSLGMFTYSHRYQQTGRGPLASSDVMRQKSQKNGCHDIGESKLLLEPFP